MSRHHPYSGYDDSTSQNGGHRKFGYGGRGSGRGNKLAIPSSRRGSASQNGFGSHSNNSAGSTNDWESNTGPDRNYSEHGSYERELPHLSRSGHKGMKSRGVRGKLRGGFSKIHTERELSIDERIQRERPCRTLFVRNVKYETDSQEVRHKFEQMGEIKIFFDLISTRGMAFITYYDLRAATISKEKLQGTNVSGRPIDVHYSLPKDNELEGRCDRDKNQATLFLAVNGATSPIDDEELKSKFEVYGEIRSIKHFKDSPYQRFVEFWDSRSCEQAHDELVGTQYLGGKLDLKFSWDTGMVPKARLSKERRGQDDGKNDYNYEQFDDQSYYDLEERGDYGHGNDTYGGHNAYEEQSDQYDPHGSYQANSGSYSNNTTNMISKPPLGGNVIDLGRLDQAQKVQELLASLTKAGAGTEPLGAATGPVASLPLAAHPYGKYPNETPVSTSSTQPAFLQSGMMPMQLPPNFTPNYPTYPVLPASKMTAPTAQLNSTSHGYKDLAQLIGQLYNPATSTQTSLNDHTPISSINYSHTNDVHTNQAIGTNSNQLNSQSTLTLPPSVLELLQKNSANSAATYPPSLPQHESYHLINSDSSPATSIPTAPRAMQESTNIENPASNYLSTQASTRLLNSLTYPVTSGAATPLTLPVPAKQGPITNDFSSLNQTAFSSTPAAGTPTPSTNTAVQQLLALLQQQQQQRAEPK